MKKPLMIGLPIAAVVMLLAVWDGGSVTGQITKGKTRPVKTEQLMEGISKPNCAALGKGLKKQPADDKAWEALALHAALLNELGYILMEDDRCPDAVWANATKTLREKSLEVLNKIEAKDLDGANAAFKEMTGACAACHKAHKK